MVRHVVTRNVDDLELAFGTRAIHAGEGPDPSTGAHNPPLYQTSTYAFASLQDKLDLFAGEREGFVYTRDANPTSRTFERKMAALEGAEESLLAASGMGAIVSTLLSFTGAGCHLIASNQLYPIADAFVREDLPGFGVEVSVVDVNDIRAIGSALRANTRAIYLELLSNPYLTVANLPAIVELAREWNLLVIVDNTFTSPCLFRPIEHGADLVIHSATKYLSGHGDVIAGVVSGRAERISTIRRTVSHLGAPISPFNAWLLLRGIKTLELRMERHCENAQALAEYLAGRPEVARVNYPGLHDHPGHELARELLGGRYSGMLSFEIEGGAEAAQQFAGALQLCYHAVSLGDVSTLVWPWTGCNLVRVSTGIESAADIIADFDQAFRAIG